jgi:hypothetical protein
MIRASAQPAHRLADRNPEQAIDAMQFGTGLLPLEDGELLAKSSGLQSESMARHEEGSEVGDYCESERNHQSDLS